jgi:hypothetical protein
VQRHRHGRLPGDVGQRSEGGWVVGRMPNSGALVLPTTTRPVRRCRRTSSWSWVDTKSARKAEPSVYLTPAHSAVRSLRTKGTPVNGPSGSSPAARSSASSYMGVTTAFKTGLRRSIRLMAASTSSRGCTSRRRTSSACAVASQRASSFAFTPQVSRVGGPCALPRPTRMRAVGSTADVAGKRLG